MCDRPPGKNMREENPRWQNEGKKLAPFPTKTAARRAISMSTAMDTSVCSVSAPDPESSRPATILPQRFLQSVDPRALLVGEEVHHVQRCVTVRPVAARGMRKVVAVCLHRLLHDACNVRPAMSEEVLVLPSTSGSDTKRSGRCGNRFQL